MSHQPVDLALVDYPRAEQPPAPRFPGIGLPAEGFAATGHFTGADDNWLPPARRGFGMGMRAAGSGPLDIVEFR
ncbi:MAG: hypothetical protein VYA67_22050 [Actinomycetota bacterium]|nr:hypothetical protein [Actinomycetota bacterium]